MGKYSTHKEYYYNGIEVPSATTVLKVLNKPALVKWANVLGFKRMNVDEVVSIKAEFGSWIHQLIEWIISGYHVVYHHPTDIFTIKDVSLALKHFRKWYDNLKDFEAIFQEKSFTGENYAGTLDLYAKIDGEYTLVDFKTSKEINMSMFIQLGLYIILLENHGYRVDKAGIVLVNIYRAKQKFITRAEMQPYIDIGLQLVNLFRNLESVKEIDKWKY